MNPTQASPIETTEDALLGGRIRLRQPRKGFRVAVDTVLLAAAVRAETGDRVLDLGCGVGGAALCLATRAADVTVHGIDIQTPFVDLACGNAQANGLTPRVRFEVADVSDYRVQGFDHVMANPPYFPEGRANAQADPSKATATVEGGVSLDRWAACASAALRHKGSFTLILDASRLDAVLAAVSGRFGGVVVYPLWPRQGEAAKRVLIQARKGSKAPLRVASGLILHGPHGYTERCETILRDAHALDVEP